MDTRFRGICISCFGDKGPGPECPLCGYRERKQTLRTPLSARTLIVGRYLIGRLLGRPGGFGITYKAWDMEQDAVVAVKEFFPAQAADRSSGEPGLTLTDPALFAHGLERFTDEASRLLALRGTPSMVHVLDYREERGTAYIIMKYYEGCDLLEHLERNGGRLTELEIRRLAEQLATGLSEVHERGLLHRDIKPSNIYIRHDRTPILLDFGSARFAISERSQSLSVFVTEGFAPFEQYQTKGRQGPWTDIYSLCATLYFVLTGERPPQAPDRWNKDTLRPIRDLVSGISPDLETAIHRGLAVSAADRPQSMKELRELWGPGSGALRSAPTALGEANMHDGDRAPAHSSGTGSGNSRRETLAALVTLAAGFALLSALYGMAIGSLVTASYVSLCYVLHLALGAGIEASFWGLCIPGYNLWLLSRSRGVRGYPSEAGARAEHSGHETEADEIHVVFDSGAWSGAALPLQEGQTVFGRDQGAQLMLDAPEVSRRHVALRLDAGPPQAILVEDLGSRNGTFVSKDLGNDDWSDWTALTGTLKIEPADRCRYRFRLGAESDRFHLE